MEVKIVNCEQTKVAVLQHRGAPDLLNDSVGILSNGERRADFPQLNPARLSGLPMTILIRQNRINSVSTSVVR